MNQSASRNLEPATTATQFARGETGRERAACLLSAIIFYGLLAWLCLSAVLYGTYEVWTEAVFVCGIFFLAALACAETALARSWRVRGGLMLLPLLALIGFMVIQAWTTDGQLGGGFAAMAKYSLSADFYETRRAALKLLALTLITALLLRHTSSPRRLRNLVFTVLLIGVGSALFGFVRMSSQTADGFILPFLRVKDKAAAQFINKNHYAFLLELTLGTSLGMLAARGIRREKLLAFAVVPLLLWAALMLTTSRGGILAFACQIIFIVATFSFVRSGAANEATRRRNNLGARLLRLTGGLAWRAFAVVILLAVVALGALWMGGDRMAERLQDNSEFAQSAGMDAQAREQTNRLGIWRASWKMFLSRPFAGHGFGGYWVAVPSFHEASGRLVPQQAHNDYLEILASGGIPGALLALVFIGLVIRAALPRLKSADAFRRAVAYGALVGLTGVATHSFFDFGLHVTINAALFAVLVVLATVNGRTEYDEAENFAWRRNTAAALPPVTNGKPRLISAQISPEKPRATALSALSFGAGDYALAAVGTAACAALILFAGKIGSARLLANYGRQTANLTATDAAVRYMPDDAETHVARGTALWLMERRDAAVAEFESAVARRPADYILWLQLGRALDFSRQENLAESAFRQAVARAPYYAEPRWQLSQTLYRAGKFDMAFAEMRRASASNPLLYPNFISFVWAQADNDPTRLIQFAQPQNGLEHLIVGRFLVKNKQTSAAVGELQAAGETADPDRRQLTRDFLDVGAYRQAFDFWLSGQPEEARQAIKIGAILDGGFEQEFTPRANFGWTTADNLSRARVLRDGAQPHAGAACLRVDFTGYEDFGTSPFAQIVIVEPRARYRLSFAYRAQDIMTSAVPFIAVTDANVRTPPLAQTGELNATNGWQIVTLDFTTGEKIEAVRLTFTRGECPVSPCPAFGKYWFDSFQLQKL